jgi:energy-converting hydrogenase Eha subunit B
LSNELAKYAFSQDQAWAPLMNYYGLVGGQNWGGQTKTKGTTTGATTATGTSTASPAATAGGILTSIGSLIPGT